MEKIKTFLGEVKDSSKAINKKATVVIWMSFSAFWAVAGVWCILLEDPFLAVLQFATALWLALCLVIYRFSKNFALLNITSIAACIALFGYFLFTDGKYQGSHILYYMILPTVAI